MIARLASMCLVAVVLFVAAPRLRAQDEVGDLLGRINNLRASQGLPGYSMNSALAAAAQQQAQWIADSGSVSHTRPDGSGPRTRAVANGYPSTQVSENIYGGTMATAAVAWTFWVNSGIHYQGMVNRSYSDVGIGVARSAWGTAYVAVFGNPGGPAPYVAPVSVASGGGGSAASSGGGGGNSAPQAPPSYVIGSDPRGNIMHQVQPGDTLGDIAMIYGYSWDDIPYMMMLNGIEDVQDLEVGTTFLVPPHGGTYTPVPFDAGGVTQTPVATQLPTYTPRPTLSFSIPSPTPVIPVPNTGPVVGPIHVATAAQAPEFVFAATSTPDAVAIPIVVAAPTETPPLPATLETLIPITESAVTVTRSGPSSWLGIAIAVQVAILGAAGVEFIRRSRRKGP